MKTSALQGHVDDTATILSKTADANSLRLLFQAPAPTPTRPSILPYLIPKGYVTLDGASLTITSVDDAQRTFGVMLIAHTQSKIGLGSKDVGRKVNVEVDMVGKYVQKAVVGALGGDANDLDGGGAGLKAMIEKTVEQVVNKRFADMK